MALAWADFLTRHRPLVDWVEADTVLCLDPGETTGWAVFEGGALVAAGQWLTGHDPMNMVEEIYGVLEVYPDTKVLVYEEYRVRGTKFKEHVGSEVVTVQHIGAIKVAAGQLNLSLVKQAAGMAKGFATDTKLRRWGLWQTNQRHANDAVRHGVYYLLFVAMRRGPHHVEPAEVR